MIRVDSLVKRYGKNEPVLRGVSFALEQGKLAAILGPSGSGKSTLLRCLVGLEPFDEGTISVDETVVQGAAHRSRREDLVARRRLRGRAGLVFQSFELFPHLTVMDNCILSPTRALGVSKEAATAKAQTLLTELGLGEMASRYPEQLSGGQRQRVAIARALAVEPRVLLYDEPTSALDPALKKEVVETLLRVRSTGVTQIVVTHDVEIARTAVEQVFVMRDGKLTAE